VKGERSAFSMTAVLLVINKRGNWHRLGWWLAKDWLRW